MAKSLEQRLKEAQERQRKQEFNVLKLKAEKAENDKQNMYSDLKKLRSFLNNHVSTVVSDSDGKPIKINIISPDLVLGNIDTILNRFK